MSKIAIRQKSKKVLSRGQAGPGQQSPFSLPLLKGQQNYYSTASNDLAGRKFRSRYVYAAGCNLTAVESLLAMSKYKVVKVFNCEVNDSESSHTSICHNKGQRKKVNVVFKAMTT